MNDCHESILRNLSVPPILTKKDKVFIYEIALEYIDEYVKENLLLFYEEDFHNALYDSLKEYLETLFENMYGLTFLNDCHSIMKEAIRWYFVYIIPMRSNKHLTKPITNNKITKLETQINILRNIPQPQQRSDDWYSFRHNMITASSAWKVFGSQANMNQLIYEKCKPYMKFSSNVNTESPLHWGQKYEPLSVLLYEKIYETQVEDFGCIKDDNHPYLGASPDGINVDKTSRLYGRMLEIKNIVNREITGIPKKEYWIQMQLQMNVCRLNECDFLETKFVEYDNYQAFIEDSDENNKLLTKNTNKMKGAFLYFNENDVPKYIFPSMDLTFDELEMWINTTIEKTNLLWVRTIYWKLDIISCVLVCRNKAWFNSAVKKIADIWSIIEKEKISGYTHRAPVARKTTKPDISNQSKCLFDNQILVIKTG